MIGEDQEFRSRGGQRPNGVVGCRAIVRLGITAITACDSLPIAVALDTYATFEARNWNVGRMKDVCATGDCVVYSPDPCQTAMLGTFRRRLGSESQMALVPLGGGAADGLRPYVLNQHEAIRLNVADLSVSFSRTGFHYLEHHEALAFTMGERAAPCLERVMLAGPPQNTFPSLRCVVVPFSR